MTKCNIQHILKAIQICNIIYSIDDNNVDNSLFIPGNSPDDKKLSIIVKTTSAFCRGTEFKLKLVGTKTDDYIMHKIKPIKTSRKLDHRTKRIKFDLISSKIPHPFGLFYVPTIITNCDQQNECRPQPMLGNALEYCFVLSIKCPKCKFDYVIPLTARYISADCKVDYKCEKLNIVDEPDDDHPIKIICNTDDGTKIVYSNKLHCVSHGQMAKPIVFYYPNA